MSLHRRSLTAAVVVALTLSGLGVSASAEEPAPSTQPEGRTTRCRAAGSGRSRPDRQDHDGDAVGLIAARDRQGPGLGGRGGERRQLVIPKVSTVDFDEIVPASVASDAAEEIEKRSDVVWAIPDTLRQGHQRSAGHGQRPVLPDADEPVEHRRHVAIGRIQHQGTEPVAQDDRFIGRDGRGRRHRDHPTSRPRRPGRQRLRHGLRRFDTPTTATAVMTTPPIRATGSMRSTAAAGRLADPAPGTARSSPA